MLLIRALTHSYPSGSAAITKTNQGQMVTVFGLILESYLPTCWGPMYKIQFYPLRLQPGIRITMWKNLKAGETVAAGDTLRYLTNSYGQSSAQEVYEVVKVEQHYFEIRLQSEDDAIADSARRKAIRYLDIGYNVQLQRWVEP